ncbi:hypothetical protein [Paracraurococcus ruber]|uniref:Uncharacterized protein n=1 Tax=Paracraurococcus ruber TaxID=77675 RepID=A0ABS1D474_9PROT|nr:hypothetical protein [Paracraurococcus ruber]MBK1661599.1 hypothetical protein [Paracraurococcus ruber]TDG18852.1 hypothetical protein E2C05_27870 [Paracraurococcus ruber]
MSTEDTPWFGDIPVLGARPVAEIAATLAELGEPPPDPPAAGAPASFAPGGWLDGLFGERLWRSTSHAFGYIAPHKPGARGPLPIAHAGNIKPDPGLRGARLRVTLNWLRVADYPGRGTHRVLFDFYARNQSDGPDSDLHFNATYRVREGQQAGILGYPVFVGLKAGEEGLAFRCYTVNVRNDADEAFLDLLESDAFKQGLEITQSVQPVIKPFAEMAFGITRAIARRNRNVPVQDVAMGLDFSNVPGRARLAEGAYVAAQVRDDLFPLWDWQDWAYDPENGRIGARDDMRQPLPYNYFVLGISRMA